MNEQQTDRRLPDIAPIEPADGEIAVMHQSADGKPPGVIFCGGFHSSMAGIKATRFAEISAARRLDFTRFDYRCHGASAGDVRSLGIAHWLADTLHVIDRTTGPLVLVGSSMGAWLSVLATERRPERVVGLLTIAAAPDFVTELLHDSLAPAEREALDAGQLAWRPTHYEDALWAIPPVLLSSGKEHRVLDTSTRLPVTATLIHGTADADVPLTLSERLNAHRFGGDARFVAVEGADHRLSDPDSLVIIEREFDALLQRL